MTSDYTILRSAAKVCQGDDVLGISSLVKRSRFAREFRVIFFTDGRLLMV